MADNQLDILIRILTEQVGQEKAADVLKKVRDETDKASSATETQTTKIKGLKESLATLFSALGPVGYMLRNVFLSTGAAAVGAFAVLLVAVIKHFQQLKKVTEALAAGVPQDLKAIEDAVREVNEQSERAAQSTKQWEEALSKTTASNIANLQAEKASILEVIKARYALAVASGADEEENRKKLETLQLEYDLKEKQLIVEERRNELAGMSELLQKKQAESQKALGGMTVPQARESVAFLTTSGQGIQAQIDNLEKVRAEAPASEKAGIASKISSLKQLRDRDIVRVRELQSGIGASEEAQSLSGRISDRQAELRRLEQSTAASDLVSRLNTVQSMAQNVVLTSGRGPTPVGMHGEFNQLLQQLAQSKMETEQLIRVLTNIFRDGVVSRPELNALRAAVSNQRQY